MTSDANTPALLVTESCRLIEDGRLSARSTATPKLDQQDQRIANIFGTKDVPDVHRDPCTLSRLSPTASDVPVPTHRD
jgi:hypothetical protein